MSGQARSSLDRARDAVQRRAWFDAYGAFDAVRSEGGAPLEPDDLELLAKAAWWTGRPGESIEAHERAYALLVERGERSRAAFQALTLRREYVTKLGGSVAMGWLTRAEQLLDGEPESAAHGYLALAHGSQAWQRGELDHALAHMERGVEVGARLGDRDLRAWAEMYRGMVLIDRGDVEEGWLLLEGVAAAAVGGELGGYTTGGVFCNVISVCRDLADYGRASEWADAAKRWCERQSISGFPGVCRVHRAEVLRLLGAWTEAESEVRLACEELREFSPAQAGAAFHELGEVRLRQGDLAGAEEAFAQAEEFREDPQPGRSLLLAARGEPASAAASIRSSLDDTWNQLKRARLLPAQAAIALLTAEPDVARAAALELGSIAESFGTSAIRADAETAWGIVALLEGNHAGALERVRAARALWREVEAPYEIASASLLMASIHLERGDLPAARLEAEAARSTFERLGATPAVARSDELLLRLAPRGPSPDVTRRTFLFSDIVGSTRLIEAIGDEAWVALRRWHDDALRRSFDDHGGQEVDHAGDGFFVAFPDARHAVDCAIEIQRKLAAHRRDHGFAPRVRMGVHATEAIAHVGDYSGRGVHEAARIGAIATADEILASVATLEHLDGVRSGEPHDEQLKGLSEPVAVLAIEWRDA